MKEKGRNLLIVVVVVVDMMSTPNAKRPRATSFGATWISYYNSLVVSPSSVLDREATYKLIS